MKREEIRNLAAEIDRQFEEAGLEDKYRRRVLSNCYGTITRRMKAKAQG
jgi:hypothetical protein